MTSEGSDESPTVWWVACVEGESGLVDCDVVVEPAEGGEVLGVVAAVIGSVFDVVGLEPISAVTAGYDTVFVSPRYIVPDRWWDSGGGLRSNYRLAVFESDETDGAAAEDLVEHLRSDSGPVLEFGTEFTAGAVGAVQIDEDGGAATASTGLRAGTVVVGRVLRDDHEGVGVELATAVIVAAG